MPLLEPDRYFSRLSHVDIERDLLALGFRFVLLDIDNTILTRDTHEVPRDAGFWLAKARDAGITFCLVSNNWHEGVYQLANRLSLPIVAKAVKPLPPAFLRALGKIGATRAATVVIGDQLVTDVLGAHFLGMKAYLLAPLVEQDLPHTLLLRNFERLVMGERKPEGAGVPTACQPPEAADAAASPSTRSRGDAGDSRTEVRFASAIPTISGITDGLADLLRQPASSSSHLRREGALCERPDQPAVAQPVFRKLCGISLEAHAGGVCVGIGVNVEPPDAVDAAAVGGKNVPVYLPELGFEGNVDDVAAAVLHAFAPLYRAWLAEGFAPLAGEYAAHASLTGRSVRMVNRAGEPVAEGTVASVDAFGRLVLRASDGSRVPVASGEAHLV